ncbi:MAG TPA: energy transducer TonB [Candidatus Angelobacter sp.]|nr:energy transducer TonB [Candidatus Angelobacter sp.]
MHKVLSCLGILLLSTVPHFAQQAGSTEKPARPTLTALEAENRVMQKVTPEYPTVARQGHMEGPVTVHVVINREGRVQKMTPLNGNPYLLVAAMEAIGKWRYKPYTLNGVRVEFETNVTLKFAL